MCRIGTRIRRFYFRRDGSESCRARRVFYLSEKSYFRAKQLFLSQEDCSIFENYPKTRSFVCNNTSDNFIFELLGDTRKEHLQTFIGRFWELEFDDVTA